MTLLLLSMLVCYNPYLEMEYPYYAMLEKDWGIVIIQDTSMLSSITCQSMQGKVTIIFRPKGIAIIDFLSPGYSFEVIPNSHLIVYSKLWNTTGLDTPSIVNIRGAPLDIRLGAFKK